MKNRNEFRITYEKNARVLLPIMILLTFAIFLFGFREHITGLCLLGSVFFLEIDWICKYYTIDEAGVHQHWFFHTDHFAWEEFKDLFLIVHGAEGTSGYWSTLCMDRGVKHRMNSAVDRDLHPFRMVVIELIGAGGGLRARWCADRESLLAFLHTLGIDPPIKPYRGFLSNE